MNQAAKTPLDVQRIRALCTGRRFGTEIVYREQTESTNSDAQHLAREGAPEGTVVVAESQSRGRGRLGRDWISPAWRNLYLSLILRPPISPAQAPQLGLVAGAAAAAAIQELCPRAALKWPNDVLIDLRKVCGTLTEMEASDDAVAYVIIGIGVNLNMQDDEFPPDLRDKATSLAAVLGREVDRTDFAALLLQQLELFYDRYLHQGFAAIREDWKRLSPFFGQTLEIDDGQRRYRGTALGLADDGTLIMRTEAGEEMRVVAGDVTVVDGYASRG